METKNNTLEGNLGRQSMAAKTPLNSQITCVDDITTSDLLDGCIVEVLATKLVHHTAKGVFFVQCGRITVGGKMEIATIIDVSSV
jgi:hypothetical protein